MDCEDLRVLVKDIGVDNSSMIKVKSNDVVYDLLEEYVEIDEEGDLTFVLKKFKNGGMNLDRLQMLLDGSEASDCAIISVKLNGEIYMLNDECYENKKGNLIFEFGV